MNLSNSLTGLISRSYSTLYSYMPSMPKPFSMETALTSISYGFVSVGSLFVAFPITAITITIGVISAIALAIIFGPSLFNTPVSTTAADQNIPPPTTPPRTPPHGKSAEHQVIYATPRKDLGMETADSVPSARRAIASAPRTNPRLNPDELLTIFKAHLRNPSSLKLDLTEKQIVAAMKLYVTEDKGRLPEVYPIIDRYIATWSCLKDFFVFSLSIDLSYTMSQITTLTNEPKIKAQYWKAALEYDEGAIQLWLLENLYPQRAKEAEQWIEALLESKIKIHPSLSYKAICTILTRTGDNDNTLLDRLLMDLSSDEIEQVCKYLLSLRNWISFHVITKCKKWLDLKFSSFTQETQRMMFEKILAIDNAYAFTLLETYLPIEGAPELKNEKIYSIFDILLKLNDTPLYQALRLWGNWMITHLSRLSKEKQEEVILKILNPDHLLAERLFKTIESPREEFADQFHREFEIRKKSYYESIVDILMKADPARVTFFVTEDELNILSYEERIALKNDMVAKARHKENNKEADQARACLAIFLKHSELFLKETDPALREVEKEALVTEIWTAPCFFNTLIESLGIIRYTKAKPIIKALNFCLRELQLSQSYLADKDRIALCNMAYRHFFTFAKNATGTWLINEDQRLGVLQQFIALSPALAFETTSDEGLTSTLEVFTKFEVSSTKISPKQLAQNYIENLATLRGNTPQVILNTLYWCFNHISKRGDLDVETKNAMYQTIYDAIPSLLTDESQEWLIDETARKSLLEHFIAGKARCVIFDKKDPESEAGISSSPVLKHFGLVLTSKEEADAYFAKLEEIKESLRPARRRR